MVEGKRERNKGFKDSEKERVQGFEDSEKRRVQGFEDSRIQVEKRQRTGGLEGWLTIYTSTHLTF